MRVHGLFQKLFELYGVRVEFTAHETETDFYTWCPERGTILVRDGSNIYRINNGLHEVAHFVVATEEERLKPEFGLGTSWSYTTLVKSDVTVSERRDIEDTTFAMSWFFAGRLCLQEPGWLTELRGFFTSDALEWRPNDRLYATLRQRGELEEFELVMDLLKELKRELSAVVEFEDQHIAAQNRYNYYLNRTGFGQVVEKELKEATNRHKAAQKKLEEAKQQLRLVHTALCVRHAAFKEKEMCDER